MAKTNDQKKAKVLVSYVYTDYKAYCRWLYPKSFLALTYEPKTVCFADSQKIPELGTLPTGEQVAAVGRNYAIKQARKGDYTHILFLDIDLMPEPDTIQRLLSASTDIAGALVPARGNSHQVIAHTYGSECRLNREPLEPSRCKGIIRVGGTAAACLLVSRRVFEAVDLDDYFGPETLPGRYTADDEYLQMKALVKLDVRPVIVCDLRPWHYDSDGFKYKCFGKEEKWQGAEN
jgi:hypothetical protein